MRKGYYSFRVDEPKRTCSCRMWQLSGLPCSHAIACIFKLNKFAKEYVPECFKKDRCLLAYSQYMKPVDGIDFWPDCSHLSRILGPLPKKMPGRPRKKRVRASHEPRSTTKISRAGVAMTCHNCGQTGHNKKGCTNQAIPVVAKEKSKGGRPRKKQSTQNDVVGVDDVPVFVNNAINEFEMGASNMRGRFNDGRVFFMGTRNKRGGSSNRGHLKMRGGKTTSGRLIPAERLGRMGTWLAMDGGSSDTIEEEQQFNDSTTANRRQPFIGDNIAGKISVHIKLVVYNTYLCLTLYFNVCSYTAISSMWKSCSLQHC